jgi:hypothetical protein
VYALWVIREFPSKSRSGDTDSETRFRIPYLYHGVFDTQRGGEEDARSEVLKEVENGKGDARAREVLV